MIRSFRDKQTESIWLGNVVRRLSIEVQEVGRRKLRMPNNAQTRADLGIPPANRLEALIRDRKGQHGIRVNDQWRICFVRTGKDAESGEIVDYR